jgi:hypothetical protein
VLIVLNDDVTSLNAGDLQRKMTSDDANLLESWQKKQKIRIKYANKLEFLA